ncbi:MAG: DUF3047 domain-containing protein [Nitrospirae bacterium]|nr:DUF3047 domain-containing protein [Nitrospirota bacterium]
MNAARSRRVLRATAVVLLAIGLAVSTGRADTASASGSSVLLDDFAGFPAGWKIKNDDPRAADIYRVANDEGGPYLSAVVGPQPGVRVFKYVAWNTRTHPVITWKWRLKTFPADKRRSVAFYVSMHRDSFGIPTIVKYLWSTEEPVGTVRPGGMFRATEVVIESGGRPDPQGWVTARVDAAADFLRFYGEEPDVQAVGIGLLVGAGIDADVADVRVEPSASAP